MSLFLFVLLINNQYVCDMKRKNLIICALLLFVMFSCSNENDDRERHVMKDGKAVYTGVDVRFYGDKDAFRGAVLENTERRDSVDDELKWEKDSLYGYDGGIETVDWEKAEFGPWISGYGLSPDKLYFVSTLKISKRIPATYEDWVAPGEYFKNDEDSIGTDADTDKIGFRLDTNISRGYYEAVTWIKCISYDGEGNTVDVYFPVSPEKLKWKYFKTKAIW